MEELAGPEYIKIYIGDGYSDFCPARHADIVFAKQTLANLCLQEDISYNDYQNFKQILSKTQVLFSADKEHDDEL